MRKVFTTFMVFAIMVAMVASAAAQQQQTEWKNVSFHCNNGKGNGKVADTGKATVPLVSTDKGKTWVYAGEFFECPACDGRIDWVAYSNNGKLNGNNVQLQHSATPEYAVVTPAGVEDDCSCIECSDCGGAVADEEEGCECPACDCEPVVVNLGFIGYYTYDFGGETGVRVISTSIHWQLLNEGDMIDWVAVDAAYDAWVAQGGLVPDRTTWQTSGFASFTFDDYADLGFGNFNIGQLESYYKAYYVCPGYVPPCVCDICDDCFCCVGCEGCACDFCFCDFVCEDCGSCLDCGEECDCAFLAWLASLPPANKGCENCQGNDPAFHCDGSGCAGNGSGPAGGDQGNGGGNGQGNEDGNSQGGGKKTGGSQGGGNQNQQ